jgi:hypothetical protein
LHIYNNESNDEKADENHFKKPWVVDMCELMRPNNTSPNVEKEKDHNQPSKFIHPHGKSLAQMDDIMQEIINEIKKGGVQLIDHTTSLLCVITTNVRGIRLSKANEVMHLHMVFHCINDGLGNSVY